MGTTRTEPVDEVVESLEQRFRRFHAEWRKDTAHLSNPTAIMAHPAMQAIIAMGEEVVPIILRELDTRPSLLVWALPAIVGARPEFEGKVSKMTNAWLQWGREKGIL